MGNENSLLALHSARARRAKGAEAAVSVLLISPLHSSFCYTAPRLPPQRVSLYAYTSLPREHTVTRGGDVRTSASLLAHQLQTTPKEKTQKSHALTLVWMLMPT